MFFYFFAINAEGRVTFCGDADKEVGLKFQRLYYRLTPGEDYPSLSEDSNTKAGDENGNVSLKPTRVYSRPQNTAKSRTELYAGCIVQAPNFAPFSTYTQSINRQRTRRTMLKTQVRRHEEFLVVACYFRNPPWIPTYDNLPLPRRFP